MPEGARWCQMVPEGARGCQRDQIGTVVARGLGKASKLIFVKVSIAAGGTGAKDGRTTWEP